MREQLSPILKFFSFIPWWLSFTLMWVSILTSFGLYETNIQTSEVMLVIGILFLILSIISGKANKQLSKFQLGRNPLYLQKKYPKDLQKQIDFLLKRKFILIDQTGTSAELERNPHFSWLLFIVLFLFGTLPGIIYVILYFM